MSRAREEVTDVPYRAPEGERAGVVAGIVAAVLDVDRVGLDDSFYDFGGTSLQAFRICVRLEQEAGLLVAPVDLLDNDVLADFLAVVGENADV